LAINTLSYWFIVLGETLLSIDCGVDVRDNVSNLGELLAPLNVKYVLLVHEVDYASYDFLYQQEDLTVELEKPGITLLKNEHPTARAYGVNSVVYINSLEE